MERRGLVSAGVIAALVGFTSSAVVVLAGLSAVGASAGQAASGLLMLCLFQGLGTIWLSRRHRIPVLLAWSTPGAALLVTTGAVTGGWSAAVGAFLLAGGLIFLTALVPALGRLIASIPAPIAQAMLAGVLFDLCLGPVRGLIDQPALVAPVVVAWLVLVRLLPRWAVPGAFAVALVVIAFDIAGDGGWQGEWWPHVEFVTPSFTLAALFSLALPLYVVTMVSQNVPGVAVLSSYGFKAPWRESMAVTGLATMIGAAAGGHAVNLAAITAALTASPDVHPDPRERWRAAVVAGWTYVGLAVVSTALAAVVISGPGAVVAAVAGLALLGTLAASLNSALSAEPTRLPAVVTFVVAASGTTFLGLGAAFWSLIAGLLVFLVMRRGGFRRSATPPASVS